MKDLELLDNLDYSTLSIDKDIEVYKNLVSLSDSNLKPEVELWRKHVMYSKIIRALEYNSKQIEYELWNTHNDIYAGSEGLTKALESLKALVE